MLTEAALLVEHLEAQDGLIYGMCGCNVRDQKHQQRESVTRCHLFVYHLSLGACAAFTRRRMTHSFDGLASWDWRPKLNPFRRGSLTRGSNGKEIIMSSHANKALAQRGYALFQAGDIDSLVQLCTDDVVWSGIDSEYVPYSGTYTGKNGVAEFFTKLHQSIEIERFEPTTFIADGDQVAVAGTSTSTVRSTGSPVENRWMHVFTIRAGKIARFVQYEDSAAVIAAFTVKNLKREQAKERRQPARH